MKILNLYAGIGGNRKLWPEGHEITAVEIDLKIAGIYQKNFPHDTVIIGDAHQFLLDHYKEFDFIWSSPPCPTHSRTNTFLNGQGYIRYPDMTLYQEIIFLMQWGTSCKWVVENVISYYDPLIKPFICDRHFFWSNFIISKGPFKGGDIGTFNRKAGEISQKYQDPNKPRYGFSAKDLTFGGIEKRQVLRNLVNPKVGLHVFNCAFKIKQRTLV